MKTEAVMNLLINILLYFTVAIILHSMLFFVVRLAKMVFLNCVALLVLLFPYYLQHSGYLSYTGIHIFSVTGLFMLSLTYSVMIIYFYGLQEKHSYMPIFLVVLCAVFINILLPAQVKIILTSLQIILSLYIIFIVSTMSLNAPLRILGAIHILNIINSIYAFSVRNDMYIAIFPSLLTLATFYILSMEYQLRLSRFIRLYRHSNELNKKLAHQVNRLKQSNEQWKHIISEKDTELFQIARHASLAEITTGIAHELAQPLTGIKGIAQNMIDDLNYNEFEASQGIAELTRISSLVDKSSSIINHIRNFSKKSGFSMHPIDLNHSILDAVDLVNHQLKKNDIEFIFNMDDSLPFILADSLSIEQLIVNLVLNAKDAVIEKKTFQLDTNGLIEISTSHFDDKVWLIIHDNGIGMPKDIIPKIWSPFFTSKKRNHGTGIGLSICSKIIKEHNAEVSLDSNSSGTTFTIVFPSHEE